MPRIWPGGTALRVFDGTDAEINRNTSRSLVDHDAETALHFVLFDLVELTVRAECQDARGDRR